MATKAEKKRWEQSHQCRGCGYVVRLSDIELKVIMAGVITCPKCETSGPINVVILDEKEIPNHNSSLNGQR